jgi:hypothetical protein
MIALVCAASEENNHVALPRTLRVDRTYAHANQLSHNLRKLNIADARGSYSQNPSSDLQIVNHPRGDGILMMLVVNS